MMVCCYSHGTAAQSEELLIKQSEVSEAITQLIDTINQDYLHNASRDKLVAHLSDAAKQGEFNGRFDFGRLKRKLEAMLFAISRDSNFEIHWRGGLEDQGNADFTPFPGTIQTEMVEPKIGYLAIDGDLIYSDSATQLDSAMASLEHANALIIDLRTAGHIDLLTAKRVISYFIPPQQTIANLWLAHRTPTPILSEQSAINVNQNTDIYIVTSAHVSGAWEFVAYTLQQANRAKIVGASTMGVGDMTTHTHLSQHLSLKMTYATLTHPKTGANWQDQGVLPDIEYTSGEAVEHVLTLLRATHTFH